MKPHKNETFEQYIDRMEFDHFTGKELARYFSSTRNGIKNSYPPKSLWPNFIPTLRIVDRLRKALGCPVRVTSSYRSPAYNKAVGGASRSQHMQFIAADIQADGATPHEVHRILQSWRDDDMLFKGGLGRYSTFVHVDTRGYNADW